MPVARALWVVMLKPAAGLVPAARSATTRSQRCIHMPSFKEPPW
jgi:hypothetical protein